MSELRKLGFLALPLGKSDKITAKERRPYAELAGAVVGAPLGVIAGAGAGVGINSMADQGQLRFLGVRRNPGGFWGRLARGASIIGGAGIYGGAAGATIGAHRTGKKYTKKSGITSTVKEDVAAVSGGALGALGGMALSKKMGKAPAVLTTGSVVVGSTAARKFLEKKAFIAVTPFKIDNPKTFHSPEGYMKEMGNRVVGSVGGAAIGAVTGGVLGGPLAPFTAGIGGMIGLLMGNHRSLRKGEREAGVPETTVGQHLVRNIASNIGGSIGTKVGGGTLGGLAGIGSDYVFRQQLKKDYNGKKTKLK